MENVKHIKNITIENFKCFDYLSVEGFSKINIILGDNNVGKTSLLEALLFDENVSQTIFNFQNLISSRGIFKNQELLTKSNPFLFFLNAYSKEKVIDVNIGYVDNKSLKLNYEPLDLLSVNIEERKKFQDFFSNIINENEVLRIIKNDKEILFRSFDVVKNFEKVIQFLPFVSSTAYYFKDLIEFYSNNFANSKESKKQLIENLQILIPNISDVEISINFVINEPILGVWLEDKDRILPLPMFGDGTIRLFRFILELTMVKNQYICIDEIDTGIHYSKFKDFSKVIISTANKNNVQLFITTHNNEFLKAFKEVLEEEDFNKHQDETKCFSLKKLPKGDIKAYSYNFNEFEFAIEQENELR